MTDFFPIKLKCCYFILQMNFNTSTFPIGTRDGPKIVPWSTGLCCRDRHLYMHVVLPRVQMLSHLAIIIPTTIIINLPHEHYIYTWGYFLLTGCKTERSCFYFFLCCEHSLHPVIAFVLEKLDVVASRARQWFLSCNSSFIVAAEISVMCEVFGYGSRGRCAWRHSPPLLVSRLFVNYK